MAMRREVVSLSQLLQRRNSARRDGSLSLSQPTFSDSGSRSATPSASIVARATGGGGGGVASARPSGCGPFKELRPPRDEYHSVNLRPHSRLPPQDRGGSGLQGFQSLVSTQLSQQSQPELGGVKQLSESQDTQDETWNGYTTSQSQSQTYISQPPHQGRQQLNDIASNQPRSAAKSEIFSTGIHASQKESLVMTTELAQGSEDVMSRLIAPIASSLDDMKTMLSEQRAKENERHATNQDVQGSVKSLNTAIERLDGYAKTTKQDCEDCHAKIANEATAARCAFEEMGARMCAMEKNVDSFISNMSRFVREELVALHAESVTTMTPLFRQAPESRARRRLVTQTPESRRYSPRPCSFSRKRQQEPRVKRESHPLGSTSACRRSIRIEKLRAKRHAELKVDSDDDNQDDDEDLYGLRLAMERVEEARAKRRQQC